MSRKKILILAQTPPPFHGQAVMQSHLVAASWDWCEKKHIRLNFSDSIDEVGQPSLFKFWRLFKILCALVVERFRGSIDVLFYPPCGPHRIPFLRDVAILLIARPLSKKLILQFHAGGFDELRRILSRFELRLARRAYGSADAALVLLPSLAAEVDWILPKHVVVVPNGIEDINAGMKMPMLRSVPTILYVGSMSRRKGIFDAIDACALLRDSGLPFVFRAVGDFVSADVKSLAMERLRQLRLESRVEFVGQKSGEEKWNEYRSADLFCFPSYETENFPVVLLEAMQSQLPVVATRWRSIPDLITDGENGLLVEPQMPEELAAKLQVLLAKPELRATLGKRGREMFLLQYTLSAHLRTLEDAFKTVAAVS